MSIESCSYITIHIQWTAKRYIERIAIFSSGGGNLMHSSGEVIEWMQKIHEWNHKFFTLYHIPENHRLFVSKFIRKVVISRMAECPDLASSYHCKLREAYATDDKLKNPAVFRRCKEHLDILLDAVEARLNESTFLGGEEFSLADVMLIPVLARLVLLNLQHEYILNRPNIGEYWNVVQRRPSYKKVIGRHFNGWRKYKTLIKTWCFLHVRNMLRRY
ncbi:glutathione S-transferase TCHQD isoform X2 [Malania oleifera]|uniref:glutathione S-transferase TCHQD isoform X2 n=1 Tax=Malania oleifera TaxID=397392 RepID=UPI0025AE2CBB|nr:glutathione S-transferase TCHQD isoform X2 [Malania oleifera]